MSLYYDKSTKNRSNDTKNCVHNNRICLDDFNPDEAKIIISELSSEYGKEKILAFKLCTGKYVIMEDINSTKQLNIFGKFIGKSNMFIILKIFDLVEKKELIAFSCMCDNNIYLVDYKVGEIIKARYFKNLIIDIIYHISPEGLLCHRDIPSFFTGEWTHYRDNGMKNSEGKYFNGSKEGSWTHYYDGDIKMMEGWYSNNKKNAKWIYYSIRGYKESEGYYSNDKKIDKWVTYFKNGNIMTEGMYLDGVRDGAWIEYSINGRIIVKCRYKNNIIVELDIASDNVYNNTYNKKIYEKYWLDFVLK